MGLDPSSLTANVPEKCFFFFLFWWSFFLVCLILNVWGCPLLCKPPEALPLLALVRVVELQLSWAQAQPQVPPWARPGHPEQGSLLAPTELWPCSCLLEMRAGSKNWLCILQVCSLNSDADAGRQEWLFCTAPGSSINILIFCSFPALSLCNTALFSFNTSALFLLHLFVINILLSIGCTNVFWEFFLQRQGRKQREKRGFLLLLGLASAPATPLEPACHVLCGTDKARAPWALLEQFLWCIRHKLSFFFQSQACVSHPNYVLSPLTHFCSSCCHRQLWQCSPSIATV